MMSDDMNTDISDGANGAQVPIPVAIRRLGHAADLPLPEYATAGSAGEIGRAACRERV